jgi:hypothetical protein
VPSSIPKWVPEAARTAIIELSAGSSLSEASRRLLRRLATDPTMKTEVWERLPVEAAGKEGLVVHWAFFAFTKYAALLPRPGRKAKKESWRQFFQVLLETPQGASPESAARLAHCLALELRELTPYSNTHWSRLWHGDRSITAEKGADLVLDIAIFLARLWEVDREFLISLPAIERPFSKKSPRIFFSRVMSDGLKEIYGRALDSVVAALTQVAFDEREGVGEETVRARRRTVRRPEKTRQERS